jgi:uncharacterized Zn-binding protein involved in type VI secretion
MTKRYHITLGATSTAGGKVTSASSMMSIQGTRMALEDDKVFCPACNSEGVIKLDGPRVSESFNGRQVALADDLCMCKCNPPPRLVANQTVRFQNINAERHAAQVAAADTDLANAPPAEDKSDRVEDAIPIRLLHPATREPLQYRSYKLQLNDGVIEGTTNAEGCTRPLTASERAKLVAWHVDDIGPE